MANLSKVLSDVFFGTQQSKYAAIAYFITIAIICFAVLFSSSDVPIEQRFVVVLFILVITIPSVLFSLFELTCIVTGGNRNTRWWCYWLAWFLSILLIIYCVFIIISLFFSMASYDLAVNRISDDEANDKITQSDANQYAKEIMNEYEGKKVNDKPTQISQFTHEVPAQMPVEAKPAQLNPLMSNDIKNDAFGTMGYDRDDNLAPISNVSHMPGDFASVKEKIPNVKEHYLNNNSDVPSSSKAPEPFSTDDNLQPY